jgi:hypothetical protein
MLKETPLEEALRLAITNPRNVPNFQRVLLESEVYIPGAEMPRPGTNLARPFHMWTDDVGSEIPFFTSRRLLIKSVPMAATIGRLSGQAHLLANRGYRLHLNPYCVFSWQFEAEQIDQIINMQPVVLSPIQLT